MTDIAHSLNSALASRYVVESEIGRGGMATVGAAQADGLSGEVVLCATLLRSSTHWATSAII